MHRLSRADFEAALGVILSIGFVSGISSSMEYNFLLAPFGATSVIAFLTHDSQFAAPKNILCGYLITSVTGVAVAFLLGHSWWTYAFGVAAAMLLKKACNTVHPPSAAMPILLISIDEKSLLHFALESVLPGLLVLVLTAIVYNRYLLKNGYPLWSFKAQRVKNAT